MKRTPAFLSLLVFSLVASPLAADWKSEVASFLGQASDFRRAAEYLEDQLGVLGEEEKPVATSLLAFLYNHLGNREAEYKRLGEYFEKYGPLNLSYEFLPLSTRNAVILYYRDWVVRYPWVLKVGFVESTAPPAKPASPYPPRKILLGIEMANDAFYKLYQGREVLRGGQLKRGFNSIAIESAEFFAQSGSYPLSLELKAGNLIVRREVVVDVRLSVFGVLENQASLTSSFEVVLKMFLGDKLLALSRKSVAAMPPVKVETPPPTGVYDPWGPGYQNKPEIPSSFPISGIPAVISELLKSLKKKDEIEPVPPVELKPDITVLFKSRNPGGRSIEILARLSLGLKEITFFPFSIRPGNEGADSIGLIPGPGPKGSFKNRR